MELGKTNGVNNATSAQAENSNGAKRGTYIPAMHAQTADTAEFSTYRKLEKNKGLIDKIKSFFTHKDHYRTSGNIKISTQRYTGEVYENEKGEVVIDGASKLTVKGTFRDDNITAVNCDITSIKTRGGKDTIHVENSVAENISGGMGNDDISFRNSRVDKVSGDFGNDTITGEDTYIDNINAKRGKDTIRSEGGNIHSIQKKFFIKLDAEIKNNPLNPGPDKNYKFRE